MNSSLANLNSEIRLVGEQYAFSYLTVSSLAWLSYDIVITFPREIDAIWRRKWTIGKSLYLISRYYALLNLIAYVVVLTDTHSLGHIFCYKWMNFFVSGQLLIPFFVDCLLVLRLYAMYNGNRKVLAFLIFCLIAQTALLISSSYITINEVVILPKFRPFRGCRYKFPQDRSRTFIPWVVAMVVQVIYFIFTLVKYVKTISMLRSQTVNKSNGRSLFSVARESTDFFPLFTLFVRDGTAAFLMILAAHFVNVFTMTFVSGPLQRSGRPWIVAVSSVMASRVYLNIGKPHPPFVSSGPRSYPLTSIQTDTTSSTSTTHSLCYSVRQSGVSTVAKSSTYDTNTSLQRNHIAGDVEDTIDERVTCFTGDSHV